MDTHKDAPLTPIGREAEKWPQLFIAAGGTISGDHKTYPWSMGFQPSYQSETRIFGRYLRDNYPEGKIAVLSSNDDFGKDNIRGLKDGLGDAANNIVAEVTYETTAPTIDSELVKLKFSCATVGHARSVDCSQPNSRYFSN